SHLRSICVIVVPCALAIVALAIGRIALGDSSGNTNACLLHELGNGLVLRVKPDLFAPGWLGQLAVLVMLRWLLDRDHNGNDIGLLMVLSSRCRCYRMLRCHRSRVLAPLGIGHRWFGHPGG